MEVYQTCKATELKTDIDDLCENCPLRIKIPLKIEKEIIQQAKKQKEILNKSQFEKYVNKEVQDASKGIETSLQFENDPYQGQEFRANRIEIYILNKERIKALNKMLATPKETSNPYSDIFKGNDNKNFLIFKAYIENHIIDWYADYSFLFQKMKAENRLHNVKHLYFMKWLKNKNYISDKVFDVLLSKTTFSKKYDSANRINNYKLIVNDIFKTTSEKSEKTT